MEKKLQEEKTVPLSQTLQELAGYPHISATAYEISYSNKGTESQDSVSDKKVFIKTYLNRFRIIGCFDSGSDLTIMHESLFRKVFSNPNCLQHSSIPVITTFSDTTIPVLGSIKCKIKLLPTHSGVWTDIFVIKDVPNQTPWLIGNDFLRSSLGSLSYVNNGLGPEPVLTVTKPEPLKCTTYYVAPRVLNICRAYYKLEPGEIAEVEFRLPPAAQVIRTDEILITSRKWEYISITPSRDNLEFCESLDCFVASGCITNTGPNRMEGIIEGKFELINKYKTIEILEENRIALVSALAEYPLAREVLELGNIDPACVPVPIIHKVTATYKEDIEVSDLDLADTVMDKEPTYGGAAPLEPAVIEPHGIDLPTVIYKDAREAIDLSKYESHLRPYIEHIFIKRFPQAVSLHALDSGNFSLTLGYTQLRLREGETLPRAKRIFHVSPSDSRHLTDICDFLIKYGYIKKAPVSPTGHHLFGVSSYLIPRAKPGCLGRLIVDFSPINPLLESPPNVIPEVTATLQFLQGKAMFTSLDLRYAFLGLKLDEASQPLTTFLTPTSSYQWLSLPVGCASSPAHFGDVCNKILHFEPDKDEKGYVIYESKNVVKLVSDPIKYVTNYVDDILVATPLRNSYEETLKFHFEILEKVTGRLAFHGAKLNVMKCEFSKGKILFLGWYITNDYIVADPRRIEKVKEFKFPESKKAIRAFLGLVNSLRRVINIEVIRQMNVLTPLTSSKNAFCPTEKHRKVFEEIKQMLIREPLFCNLIDERAEKFLFVDAATSTGVLGSVLLQRIKGNNEKIIPEHLDLDNEVHRIIFDKDLPYEPVKLITSFPIVKLKPTAIKTIPPNVLKEERLLGYTEQNIVDL